MIVQNPAPGAPIYKDEMTTILPTGNASADLLLISAACAERSAREYDTRADKLRSQCSEAQVIAQKLRDEASAYVKSAKTLQGL